MRSHNIPVAGKEQNPLSKKKMVLYVSVYKPATEMLTYVHVFHPCNCSHLYISTHSYSSTGFVRINVIGEMILNIAFDGILAINILW